MSLADLLSDKVSTIDLCVRSVQRGGLRWRECGVESMAHTAGRQGVIVPGKRQM